MILSRRHALAAAAALLLPAGALAQTPERGLLVFAAASLAEAMKDIAAAWTAAGHPPLTLSLAASSTLARQIEQGAPADLFASADEQWMDWAEAHGLIAPGTRRSLLSNELVLVVPASNPVRVAIRPGFDLAGLLGADGRLAVGDPAHVPVGIYAQQALTKLGVWGEVENRLARTADVRAGLRLVARGEVPTGIVYATDAAAPDAREGGSGVRVAGRFPNTSHAPISYPFAITRAGDGPAARALMAFLAGPEARAIFARRGFGTE